MVFVPASEKGDDNDYVNLIKIIEKLTGLEITPIRVTDYNAAVEAMRAGRAQIAKRYQRQNIGPKSYRLDQWRFNSSSGIDEVWTIDQEQRTFQKGLLRRKP